MNMDEISWLIRWKLNMNGTWNGGMKPEYEREYEWCGEWCWWNGWLMETCWMKLMKTWGWKMDLVDKMWMSGNERSNLASCLISTYTPMDIKDIHQQIIDTCASEGWRGLDGNTCLTKGRPFESQSSMIRGSYHGPNSQHVGELLPVILGFSV